MAMTELEHAQKTITTLQGIIERIAVQRPHVHCDEDPIECSYQAADGEIMALREQLAMARETAERAVGLLQQADIAIDSMLHHDADRAHNARMILDQIRGRADRG